MSDIIKQAAQWAADLYKERTILVAQDRADISIAHPAYRVDWHEINKRFPMDAIDRVVFQKEFEKCMRKHKLIKVLRGTQTSLDWYNENVNI